MLSIEPIAGGGDYHAYLLSEYYLEEKHSGHWFGDGATALGLTGEVRAEAFAKLLDGFDPDGKSLVQNAGVRGGKRPREPGWDLTFSAPKDVSVMWALAAPEVREQVRQAHAAAVSQALDYLNESAGKSRQRSASDKRVLPVQANLVFARFNHGVSREHDPQLHTHCVTFNIAVRSDGSTGAVLSRPLYQHKMTAGALYQASLAAELVQRLGLQLTPEKHGFRIDGIPRELAKHFSKRREQIEQEMASHGSQSAQASAVAAKETRKGKTASNAKGLFERWQTEALPFGVSAKSLQQLVGRVLRSTLSHEQAIEWAIAQAATKLLTHDSYFSEKELLRETANRCKDGRANGEGIRRGVRDWLTRSPIVRLGELANEPQFTTQAVLDLEQKLLADAAHLAKQQAHAVASTPLEQALRKYFPEGKANRDDPIRDLAQRTAVEHLTSACGLSLLSGLAGTGKTTVLKACREVWEQSGYQVIGIAQAGIAAKNLQEASGIPSDTLTRTLLQYEGKGFLGTVWHHIKQVTKTAANELHRDVRLPIHQLASMNRNTVVVLDEAGMVGSHDFGRLLTLVRAAGAKLVAVGDAKQLQAVGAGSPFAHIEQAHGAAHLARITRQKLDAHDPLPAWKRDAVRLFSDGKAKAALAMFEQRGFVSVERNRQEACQKLVADWVKAGGVTAPREHLVIAGTNAEVRSLNALCQKQRLASLNLKQRLEGVEVNGEVFYPGDRILFTKKDRSLQLDNGELGAVVGFGGVGRSRTISVQMDDGRAVQFPLSSYSDIRLGYAMTTHKVQGTTVAHAYVLLGGGMQDLHLSYVQASRAVESTRFYLDRFEAGSGLDSISKRMSQERPKKMAHALKLTTEPHHTHEAHG